jgi:hypothetical protein
MTVQVGPEYALPAHGHNLGFGLALFPGFPLTCLNIRIPCQSRQETIGSHKFLPLLSTHATLQDTGSPSGISPLRFLCIGFRFTENVADCIDSITMLTASGMCASLVAYVVLCVRFVSLVRVCRSRNRLQRSARNATLDTGGWLDLSRQGLSP